MSLIAICLIRAISEIKLKRKFIMKLDALKKILDHEKKPIVIVAGCVAQAENEEMIKREPYIDIVIGPQALSLIHI